MSVKLMSAIFETEFRDLTDAEGNVTKASTAKIVCLALADHANDEGEGAYPSVTRLERKTALSRQCVINTLDALKYNGIARLEGVSKRNTNNYTIEPNCFPRSADRDSIPALLVNPVTSASKPGVPELVNPVDPNHTITIIEPSTLSQIEKQANRKVDAILDQERLAVGKVNYPKRESLPEPIRELIDAFVEATGIKPLAKETVGWLMVGQDWLNLGASPADIRGALDYAKGKFAIMTPHSLTNTLRAYKAGQFKPQQQEKGHWL